MSSSKTTINELGGTGYIPRNGSCWVEIPHMGDTTGDTFITTGGWITHRMDSEYETHKEKYDKHPDSLQFTAPVYYDEVTGVTCRKSNSYIQVGRTHPNNNPNEWQQEINDLFDSGVTGFPNDMETYPSPIFRMSGYVPERGKNITYTATFSWYGR